MSDVYSTIFSDDPRTGTLTYPQLEARRRIAIALATRNRPYPKTIGEGLTALGEGLGEGMYNQNLARAETAQSARDAAATQSLTPGATSPRPAPGGASIDGDPAAQALAYAAPDDATETKQPLTTAQASQQRNMPIEEWMQRVARNESGLRKDAYTLVGERSRRGDYPYGKYQVMGENIPAWTKGYLGKEMTPKEFLADPEAQEKVARARGNEYLTKYGPEGAAAAWFAGENGMNDPSRKDTLGRHVAEYKRRFNIPLVSRDQVAASVARAPVDPENAAPVQVASLGGVPTPDTAPDPARDAMVQSLVAQQGVQPQQQQQVAQAAPAIGPAPLPVPPSAAPIVTPRDVPRAPAVPAQPVAPGPEPKLETFLNDPRIKPQMDNAKQKMMDQSLSPHINAVGAAEYKRLQDLAKDEYTKQWTVWHERDKTLQAFKLGEEDRKLQSTKLRGEVEDATEKRIMSQRLGGRDPEKFFTSLDQERDATARQGHMLSQIKFAEDAINAGVISGFGADMRINYAKMRDWMFNNKIEGTLAANTERLQAAAKSMLGQAVQNIQGKDPRVSEGDIKVASGTIAADPSYQLETMKKILADNKRVAIRGIKDYEDKVDYYLAGHRAERNYQLPPIPTDTSNRYTQRLLEHQNNDDAKKEYDRMFGEGAADLEIARVKRRERRGG